MARKISIEWMNKKKNDVRLYLGLLGIPIEPVVTSYNPSAQWYIAYLEDKGIKCKVVQLGAGVKKIIINENICPHCDGKGTI